MNDISAELKTGTIGELLVQIRLLQYGVQAAPPLKDSGNDLIAVKGDAFRAIQVKTGTKERFDRSGLPERYHILAAVQLVGSDNTIELDSSKVFLIPQNYVSEVPTSFDQIADFRLTEELVNQLF